jgi:hypothetical protein
MLAILDRQGIDDQWRHAWKAADIAAYAILEHRHRIAGTAGCVEPSFQGRYAERDIESGDWMAPGLGREQSHCAV